MLNLYEVDKSELLESLDKVEDENVEMNLEQI